MLRDRQEPNTTLAFAKDIKEKYGYVSRDILKEFSKFDESGSKFKLAPDGRTEIGYEVFMAPEVFFHPEFANDNFTAPLSSVVDKTIQACPIDTRRDLYRNITLSGGSTMFKDFSKRLQRDIKRIVKKRVEENERINNVKVKNEINVKVIAHKMQRFAVWFGG